MKTKGSAYLKRARKRMTTKRDIVQAFRVLLDRAVDIGYKAGQSAGQKKARRRARVRATK
jgi:hypothetical protein